MITPDDDWISSSNPVVDQHRRALVELIGKYRLKHGEESSTIATFEKFICTEPACFHRSTAHGHITAAAWLVDPSGERVLLTHHAKLNKWLQLGGHADGNGAVHEVAHAEAREESGIQEVVLLDSNIFDLDIHVIPVRSTDPEHLHYDVRFIAMAAHTNHVVSSESNALAWVPIREIGRYTREQSMVRMARKWLLNGEQRTENG
jgi:8-oxo-dGTP pyrophosphatase MutT (NUDIX family)